MTSMAYRLCNRGGGLLRSIVAVQAGAFGVILAFLWLDELLDLPYQMLGADATPVNWRESLLETALVVVLGVATVSSIRILVNRIRHLEGFLVVCAYCKRIRINDEWIPLEDYISSRSTVKLSHSFCPDCVARYYPEESDSA